MAVATSSAMSKGPILDPALCRCCRSIKKCRLLTVEYDWRGTKEVYSDMIMDCFGLLLSHSEGDPKESCICATCVVRLRDANSFRRQVLQCEQAFMDAKLQTDECETKEALLDVKSEPDGDCNVSDSDDDNTPLYDLRNHHDTTNIKPVTIKKHEDADMSVKNELNPDTPTLLHTSEKCVLKLKKPKQLRNNSKYIERRVNHKDGVLVELPEAPPPKKRKTLTKIEKDKKADEDLVYNNALTIIYNSYVTPFVNHISIYYCYYCRDQFTDPNELRRHTLTHDPTIMFTNMMYNSKKLPQMDITRIDCRLCEENINDINSLKSHLRDKHGKVIHDATNELLTFKLELDKVACTECEATFPYFDMLKKHMIDHFGDLICDQCGACFLEISSLRTHLRSHSKVEVLFPCEICGKNLKSKYSMIQHIATVHEKKPTVNCYKCDAMFLSHALRTRHLIEVHADKRTFPCKFCDKIYNRRKTLAEHNRRNHAKVFKHQCELCDQKFYVPSRLKDHMATHTGERRYRCDICDKSYPRLQTLQEHSRLHTNEKRFKCSICSSTFTQNASLKSHMKSHHQGYELNVGDHY